ncbi:hypothetical protein ACGF3J_21640 [Streptomyces sp. NPDC048171]|uniref:hypothetical protein n=1 Tax=unclassified Streptomyces TaxID=2593676 RepID=UPI0019273333|nr:hypothetical protein [Streptomyces sp. SID5789]
MATSTERAWGRAATARATSSSRPGAQRTASSTAVPSPRYSLVVTADYDCRAETAEDLAALQARVRACFEAGALATGAELALEAAGNDYADLRQDLEMCGVYRDSARELGRSADAPDLGMRGGSTDMGNVSHLVPTIHPSTGYDCGDTIMHNPEFTRYGTSAGADRAVLDGGLAMAWTAITLASDDGHRARLLARLAERRAG